MPELNHVLLMGLIGRPQIRSIYSFSLTGGKNGQKKDRLHNKRLQFTISWNRVVFG